MIAKGLSGQEKTKTKYKYCVVLAGNSYQIAAGNLISVRAGHLTMSVGLGESRESNCPFGYNYDQQRGG